MNITKYLFHFAVAATAFFIGHSAYAGARYLLSNFDPIENDRPYRDVAQQNAELIPMVDISSEHVDGLVGGNYYLFDEALMKGFPDFDYVAIQNTDDKGLPIPPRGSVYTKQEYKFKSVSISNDGLAFETEAIRGISYRFSGTYGVDLNDHENGSVLRGHFTKLQNKQALGLMYATFYPGGC